MWLFSDKYDEQKNGDRDERIVAWRENSNSIGFYPIINDDALSGLIIV